MRVTEIAVDLRDVSRQLIRAQVHLPVQPGKEAHLTLPLWLCESHCPNGVPGNLAGLVFADDNGHRLPFDRDPAVPHVLIIDVPENVCTIHATFEAVCSGRTKATRQSAMFQWEAVLLHSPIGDVRPRRVKASIILPNGWNYSSALDEEKQSASLDEAAMSHRVHFAVTTMERLLDSPILLGKYLVQLPITPDHQHIFSLATHSAEKAALPPSVMCRFHRLIHETHKMLGPPPYRKYNFLALQSSSTVRAGGGIEHAESTELFVWANLFSDPEEFNWVGDIVAHEFIHSWNGKFRRPHRHNHESWLTPLDGRLLWVYEGLTSYLAMILAARAGIGDAEIIRQRLAAILANQANQSARSWESVQDAGSGVAVGSVIGQRRPAAWYNYTAGMDYYGEGLLIWLEIDTIIRTQAARRVAGETGCTEVSLDDFCREFFDTEGDCTPRVKSYTLDDICASLAKVAPGEDWASYFDTRVKTVCQDVNAHGIENAGYRFGYTNDPSQKQTTQEVQLDVIWYSLGVRLDDTDANKGKINDIRRHSAADDARLAPGQVITEIDGQSFHFDLLMQQVRQAQRGDGRIMVKVEQDGETWETTLHWEKGLLYPVLWRDETKRDLFPAIITSRSDVSDH